MPYPLVNVFHAESGDMISLGVPLDSCFDYNHADPELERAVRRIEENLPYFIGDELGSLIEIRPYDMTI